MKLNALSYLLKRDFGNQCDTAAVDYDCVEGFLAHMERSLNPDANIKNNLSYFKRSFINYLINIKKQSNGKLTC